jgi:hypothetical protein
MPPYAAYALPEVPDESPIPMAPRRHAHVRVRTSRDRRSNQQMRACLPGAPPCEYAEPSGVMSHSESLSRLTLEDRRTKMIKWALHKAVDKFERNWNYDASYMRHIIDASARAAWLFSRVTTLGQFRRDIPIEPWFAAGITAVRHEDCGPCTQLAILRALLADNPDAMPPDVALVWNFTRATLAHDATADEYRERIVKCWGRRALVSVAFAITAARIYPTVKYALGHGKACMRVVVGGTPVMFDHGRVPAPADVAVRTA